MRGFMFWAAFGIATLTGTLANGADGGRPYLVPQSGHTFPALRAVVTDDGRWLVTTDSDGSVALWETATGKVVRRFRTNLSLEPTVLAPDGRQLLLTSWDSDRRLPIVQVMNSATGRAVRQFIGAQTAVSSNAKWVMTSGPNEPTRLWDTANGKEAARGDWKLPEDGRAYAVSNDGRVVAVGRVSGEVVIRVMATNKSLPLAAGHTAAVFAIAFSGDSTALATAGEDGMVRVWDTTTGKEIRRFAPEHWAKPKQPLGRIAISFDGRFVMTSSIDGAPALLAGVKVETVVWDVTTGKPVRRYDGEAVGFAADGRTVFTSHVDLKPVIRMVVRKRDAETGKVELEFANAALGVSTARFSPNGNNAVTEARWAEELHVWDFRTGRVMARLTGVKPGSTRTIDPNGRLVSLHDSARTLRVLDPKSGAVLETLSLTPELKLTRTSHHDVSFTPAGHLLITGTMHLQDKTNLPTVWVFDRQSGKELQRFDGYSVAVDPACRSVLTVDKVTARVFDVGTGKQLGSGPTPQWLNRKVPLTVGGGLVAGLISSKPSFWFAERHSIALWDSSDFKSRGTIPVNSDDIWPETALALSPDGGRLCFLGRSGELRIWDTKTLQEIVPSATRSINLRLARFSSDGRWLIAHEHNGGTLLIDPKTNRELCDLHSFADGTWAVVDPDGRYDASNGGDVNGLHWVVGLEPIALSQLKNRYYEPGLLAKILGFNTEPLRRVEAFANVPLYPDVAIKQPAAGASTATVKLSNRGGGIGKVVVFVNGKELLADARGPKPDPDAKDASLSIDLSTATNLVPGKANRISVVAYNAEGYLSSRGAEFDYEAPMAPAAPPPELHAIVCGTSSYANPKLNLKYAAKDAEDFATALKIAGTRLFGEGKVHVTLMITSDDPKATPPTKENIKKAFETLHKSAKPADVLVVYLAGHGTTLSRGSDTYLYPTRDATSLAGDAFADPAVLAATAVTSEELTEWVKKVPANKQVMILDTCAAGAAATKLTEKRDVSGDQVRALDRLKDRTGFHVLMGCSADAVSYETSRFAQGLLTYSLLEGMKGAALRDGEFVEVDKLFSYATDRVPALAGDVGGVQRPLVAAPRGGSFPVGRLTAEDKPKVPLAVARPLVLRTSFQDEVRVKDGLGLTKLVDERLRDLAGVGRGSRIVFVDAAEFPGALEVAGRFKVDGEKVTVRVTVFKGEAEVAAFTVEGDKAKLPDLAAKVVAEIEKRLPEVKSP